jgi:hypothetical protein
LPLPSLLCIAFASGVASAIAGRSELRVSPRPALLTRSFGAYAIFLSVLLVPISVYFYVFHGDWYLLYLVDVRRVPSALALLSFMGHVALGAAGFLLGAGMVRSQRDVLAGLSAGAVTALGVGVFGLARARLSVVGTYAQYHRGFGLAPITESGLLDGGVLMSVLLVIGLAALLFRVHWGTRKGT